MKPPMWWDNFKLKVLTSNWRNISPIMKTLNNCSIPAYSYSNRKRNTLTFSLWLIANNEVIVKDLILWRFRQYLFAPFNRISWQLRKLNLYTYFFLKFSIFTYLFYLNILSNYILDNHLIAVAYLWVSFTHHETVLSSLLQPKKSKLLFGTQDHTHWYCKNT